MAGSVLEERELAAARNGDEDAYRRLLERYTSELHAHCYRMLGSVHDAEDALQDAMLRAWRSLDRFEGRSAFKSWLYRIAREPDSYTVSEAWNSKAQGYMSTPVVVNGHAYLHLGNQRFACINLQNGERTWTSQPFGKYASLIVQGDRILALDQQGMLLLIKANPERFELLDSRKVSEEETWGHLAISGEQLFVRELEALAAYGWRSVNRPSRPQ